MSDGDVIKLPFRPKLGRHIQHDPRSRRFAVERRRVPLKDVRWRRYGPKLNQGYLGACVGFAAAHCLNALPLRRSIAPRPTFRYDDAVNFYGWATQHDPWPETYPPDDTGTTGLAACQALQEAGIISRYEWAFGFEHGLNAIGTGPLMQGTWWTDQMFESDSDGRVRIGGDDAGGHEYLWVGIEYRSRTNPGQNRSWFMNSWGNEWGKSSYFYLTWVDHEELLNRDGDLIRPVI